jgi:tetratricopeptide (TPR) repeat protein
MSPVSVRRETVVLPTYRPQPADKNPMFLETRVYQGSSGRVYPLPFIDRIAEKPTPQPWDAIYLENEYLLVMLLPALGGRIHRLVDKTNGYDTIYHQPVIKPALVGLAGPWISGGIEFNWPQHHRPSTFMPAEVAIEEETGGAITVWLGEHEPMNRMKGMHGVRLAPGRAVLELRARVHNRTGDVQTFLWWANVATEVHERYQSFFPPDATYVADHAKRAMSTFPLCSGRYYGVDYAARARSGVPAAETPRQYVPTGDYPPNDLSWYANIPVPTSYMCMGTRADFFGGYDHREQAGIVHVADRHIAPGKKQWTWGNHEFGYAWDRNLTDANERGEHRPYIELMAGVYTDNQPDFSFLQPGETKTWSQFWYPIRRIGPAQAANTEAALSLRTSSVSAQLGVAVTAPQPGARVILRRGTAELAAFTRDLSPAEPLVETVPLPRGTKPTTLTLEVFAADGRSLATCTPIVPKTPTAEQLAREAATEPPAPADVPTSDELYLTGLHLEQYRHATRKPELYWREALRRDPGDSRCHLALGRWHLRRGEFADAEQHLRASIARQTFRNPNPADGEALYQLGRCLQQQVLAATPADRAALLDAATDAYAKATWNQAWQSAGHLALAEIACTRTDWSAALAHLERSRRLDTDNLRARGLATVVHRRLGRTAEADAILQDTLRLDPLDVWARHLAGQSLPTDNQFRLDLALDYARAGLFAEALGVVADADTAATDGTAPLVSYYRAWFAHQLGDAKAVAAHLDAAAKTSPDYCFPARLEEIAILQFAIAAAPRDARAPFYLGNLFYDRRRHAEAIKLWERAVRLDPANAVAWRNLGIGTFNILGQPAKARRAYESALRANLADARLLFERDQLWKRLGEKPAKRLRELERHSDLVRTRDDLCVELCTLLNQTGRPAAALALLESRKFQPWEGGEGQSLGQHVRTHLLLGRAALATDPAAARTHFEQALAAPENLGEAKHLLANQSDIRFWLGEACAAAGDKVAARAHWTAAATFKGDFQNMSVRAFSEMTYYSALALRRLGKKSQADRLLRDLLAYAQSLAKAVAKIDYFATSLPTMLLFADDLQARQLTTAKFLEAQARLGLGEKKRAAALLAEILRRDPNHPLAADLASSIS